MLFLPDKAGFFDELQKYGAAAAAPPLGVFTPPARRGSFLPLAADPAGSLPDAAKAPKSFL